MHYTLNYTHPQVVGHIRDTRGGGPNTGALRAPRASFGKRRELEALSLLKSYVDCTAQQGADGADAEGGRRDGERGGERTAMPFWNIKAQVELSQIFLDHKTSCC